MCFLSHIFSVSFLSRLMLFNTLSVLCLGSDRVSTLSRLRLCFNILIVFQIMSQLQATCCNQLCVTGIKREDIWRNKMYIERADILHSVELLDQSLMRSVLFNQFINEIFALSFDRFWARRTLTRTWVLPSNTLIFEFDFWPKAADLQPLTWSLTQPLTSDPISELWSLTFDLWLTAVLTCKFWLDLWPDFWPLTAELMPLTCDLWLDPWPNLWALTFDLQPWTNGYVDFQPLTQPLILDLRSPAFNQAFFFSDNLLFHPVFIMTETVSGSRDKYTFEKLQGFHNYKQWTRDMRFALKEARL